MLFFFKVISVILAIFINLWLQNLDCIVMSWGGFLFSVVCKMRGLVSHILLFIDSDFILSPYEFSHFPYLSFYVKKKKPKDVTSSFGTSSPLPFQAPVVELPLLCGHTTGGGAGGSGQAAVTLTRRWCGSLVTPA